MSATEQRARTRLATAIMHAGCALPGPLEGPWRTWPGPGNVCGSWVRPVRFLNAAVPGHSVLVVPSSPAQIAAGASPLRARAGFAPAAGRPGQRARCFRFSVQRLSSGAAGQPFGSPRFFWLVWAGQGFAPPRAHLGRWLAGALKGWVLL